MVAESAHSTAFGWTLLWVGVWRWKSRRGAARVQAAGTLPRSSIARAAWAMGATPRRSRGATSAEPPQPHSRSGGRARTTMVAPHEGPGRQPSARAELVSSPLWCTVSGRGSSLPGRSFPRAQHAAIDRTASGQGEEGAWAGFILRHPGPAPTVVGGPWEWPWAPRWPAGLTLPAPHRRQGPAPTSVGGLWQRPWAPRRRNLPQLATALVGPRAAGAASCEGWWRELRPLAWEYRPRFRALHLGGVATGSHPHGAHMPSSSGTDTQIPLWSSRLRVGGTECLAPPAVSQAAARAGQGLRS